MNDLQIDCFMAVATNSSFTKTSEELFVSQPAISKQIALLERELGVKLFIRNNRRTELTEAGKRYFDFFSRYKTEMGNIKHEVSELDGITAQTITIGILEGWDFASWLTNAIKKYRDSHGYVDILINYVGAKEVSTLLLTDEIDIAISLKNTFDTFAEIESRNILETRKKLVYNKQNMLAMKGNLSPADFANEKFFAPWSIMDDTVTKSINMYMQPYGIRPKIQFVNNFESMINCVRYNLGVAICDEFTGYLNDKNLESIDLQEKEFICAGMIKNSTNDEDRELYDLIITYSADS